MRCWIVIFSLVGLVATAQLQMPVAASVTLQSQGTEGSNGSSVVWCPAHQTYYTAAAGNANYPIERFDAQGKWLGLQASGSDNRGLWFDHKKGKLMGRSIYGEVMAWGVDASGAIQESNVMGTLKPGESQAVACGVNDVVYIYEKGTITKYSASGKTLAIIKLIDDFNEALYNPTSMGYTGVKNYEFVLLDIANSMVAFFNTKGKHTASLTLPAAAPHIERFGFSYANNMVWLFDGNKHLWSGFKVF